MQSSCTCCKTYISLPHADSLDTATISAGIEGAQEDADFLIRKQLQQEEESTLIDFTERLGLRP